MESKETGFFRGSDGFFDLKKSTHVCFRVALKSKMLKMAGCRSCYCFFCLGSDFSW